MRCSSTVDVDHLSRHVRRIVEQEVHRARDVLRASRALEQRVLDDVVARRRVEARVLGPQDRTGRDRVDADAARAEFARQLSARGYNLLLVARRADRLEKLSDQLTTVCEIFTADLSKKSECLRLVKALEGRRVDLFINNAGFGDCGPFLQTELDKDLDMLSVNIRALHILTKKIGQQLYKQGFGALLNVGSCAGLMPAGPYMATYYATKAYVVSLTSALAQELREARSPVYVGCLCPGPVNTEFNAVANVEFALRGITPEYCVRCALDGMARRKTVIVPNPVVAAGMTLGRFLPRPVYIKIAAHQQRKKLYKR